MELVQLGQPERIADARRQDLEDGVPALDVDRRHESLVLLGLLDLHAVAVEHAKERPRSFELDPAGAGAGRRQDRHPDLTPPAGPGELHAHRHLGTVSVADQLAVDVEEKLLDRGVHLHRLEFELDRRRAAPPAEEHVTDDLGALELGERELVGGVVNERSRELVRFEPMDFDAAVLAALGERARAQRR